MIDSDDNYQNAYYALSTEENQKAKVALRTGPSFVLNEFANQVEIRFDKWPSAAIRHRLKMNGFIPNKAFSVWHAGSPLRGSQSFAAKQSPQAIAFAQEITSAM